MQWLSHPRNNSDPSPALTEMPCSSFNIVQRAECYSIFPEASIENLTALWQKKVTHTIRVHEIREDKTHAKFEISYVFFMNHKHLNRFWFVAVFFFYSTEVHRSPVYSELAQDFCQHPSWEPFRLFVDLNLFRRDCVQLSNKRICFIIP